LVDTEANTERFEKRSPCLCEFLAGELAQSLAGMYEASENAAFNAVLVRILLTGKLWWED